MKRALTLLLAFLLISSFSKAQFLDEEKDLTPLLVAVRANSLKEVKRLVEAGEPINTSDRFDKEPVDLAVSLDHREIALYLLSKGASSRRHFYTAVSKGDLNWIKSLLDYKYYDSEAMIPAVESGNIEIVKYLISQGFPVDFEQKRRSGLFRKHYVSPLEIALDKKADAIVLELVKGGVPINEAFYTAALMEYNNLSFQLVDLGKSKDDLFLVCSKTNNVTVLTYCLQKGANKNAKDSEGKNALLLAAEYGRKEMFDHCLKELKLPISSISDKKENALMLAAEGSNTILFSEILDLLSNIEAKNSSDETVLFYAERSSSKEMIDLLLTRKPNVNKQNLTGNTALIQAANAGRNNNVRKLLDAGADHKLMNNYGRNVISGLTNNYSTNKHLIYELIEKGADANVKGEHGSDLAFFAIENNDLELLKLLKEKGVSTDGRNASGYRPGSTNKEIILFVLENGGDPNVKDTWGTSYLCAAVDKNDIELAAVLIRYKVNVNTTCSFSESPLIKAIDDKNLLFVQFLVESGADLYSQKSSSKNVMEYAIAKKEQEIIDYLRKKGALTKEELNIREVERARDMRSLETYITNKDITAILNLLNKYPEAILTQKEIQAVGILSAQNGSFELLQIFLERLKWDINSSLNFENKTLLHFAAAENDISFVTLLVNKGADVNKKDAFDKCPIDYARKKEIKKFLKGK